jgi:uncharacterized protein
LDAGTLAVRYARAYAEAEVRHSRPPPPPAHAALAERRGGFVTLWGESGLRGCVGHAEPFDPLRDVLAMAARGAVRDPRFERVRARDLDGLRVEVSVLTPPRPLDAAPENLPERVRVGDHGLIVQSGRRRGLLLPQVAVEHGLTAAEFLTACCRKAGVPEDAWQRAGLTWHTFEAQVFEETTAGGAIERRSLSRPETG